MGSLRKAEIHNEKEQRFESKFIYNQYGNISQEKCVKGMRFATRIGVHSFRLSENLVGGGRQQA
jgi:hypothetical protein